MTRHFLKIHPRYIRRQFEKSVGKSIPKILTELTTNSDDSYRRMMKEKDPRISDQVFGTINITANRKKRTIRVVDQAQGLSKDEMERKFVWYGDESDDRAKGIQTRSLFGKGLRDVLFTQKVGFVKSIKDNVSYVAKFYWGKEKGMELIQPAIDIKRGPRVNKDLRVSWGISENGTLVEFKCRKDVRFLRHENLLEKISNFYMLRMINQNPERKLTLTTIDKSQKKETKDQIKYTFPTGELIRRENLTLNYEEKAFPVELEILKSKTSLIQGGLGYEEREGGLLVLDEESNILDLTLFSFDNDPSASRLFGILRILGVGSFIRDKLNSSPPEEILSEVREGLVRKHKFYRTLAKLIDPILEPIVEEEEKLSKRPKGEFSSETVKRHNEAMEILNKLYRELVGKIETGDGFQGKKPYLPEFISFIKPHTTITERVVTPLALLVNCNKVPHDAKVYISCDHPGLSASPEELLIDHSSAKEGLLIKLLQVVGNEAGITATLTAQVSDHSTSIVILVIEKTIFYPQNGIEFHPYQLRLPEGKARKLHLYIDTAKVPLGSIIDFGCKSDRFKLSVNRVQFSDDMKISSEIGRVALKIRGRGIGQEAMIEATTNGLKAIASAIVVSKKEKKPPTDHGGRFNPPKFVDIPNLKVQTWLRPKDGTILVNMLDPVNKAYFGKYPYLAVDEKTHCQVRLADLVLDECLNEIVSNAWGRSLPRRFPDNPEVDIRRYVAQMKFEIGPAIHKYFVKTDLERE